MTGKACDPYPPGDFNSDDARYGAPEKRNPPRQPDAPDPGTTNEAIPVEELDAENDGGAG